MDVNEVFSNPMVVLIAGYCLSEWRSGRTGQASLGQNAASFEARLQAAEAWINRHNDVREVLGQLGERMRTVFNIVEDIADRLDAWGQEYEMPRAPAQRRQPVRRRVRR